MQPHSPDFNSKHFDRPEAWPDDGTGWSAAWGGVESQWQAVIEPRIFDAPRDGLVVDVGCGHGRWSNFLAWRFADYLGVDVSAECVKYCRGFSPRRFVQCDGRTIPIADGAAACIFSFDSLVHADCDSCCSYVRDAWRALRPGGLAFLHLSSFATSGREENGGWRSPDGDWRRYVEALNQCDTTADVKVELIAWMQREHLNDCFVTFRKQQGRGEAATVENFNFMAEHA